MKTEEFVRGQGRYLADLPDQDCLHVAFVRSPHAHARVGEIRAPESSALIAMCAGVDLLTDISPFRVIAPGHLDYDWYPLAHDRVLFVGEPVAAVVAETPYIAEDLAAEVEVEYDPLDAVTTLDESIAGQTVLHAELEDNVLFNLPVNEGGTADTFATAHLVVEQEFEYPRQNAVPLETRGVLARFDPRDQRYTVFTSTQIPHLIRSALSQILNVNEDNIRVIKPDVGGGFGLKGQLFPEEVVLPALARKLGRPLKWIEDRRESLMAGGHAHEERLHLSAAFDADGNLLATKSLLDGDSGAHSTFPFGAGLDPLTGALNIFGAYRHKASEFTARAFATNKAPAVSYRGVGQVQSVFAVERLMDIAAGQLKLDPAELRKLNLYTNSEFPVTSPGGNEFDTGSYRETLEIALDRVDYTGLRREQETAREEGRLYGIGLATFNEVSGVSIFGYDGASIRIGPDGQVRAFLSTGSSGQGHEKVYGRLVAEALGISPELVRVIEGDTDFCPVGAGTYASRSMVTTGNLLESAARELRDKVLMLGGLLLCQDDLIPMENAANELRIADGVISLVRDPTATVTFEAVAQLAHMKNFDFPLPQELVEAGLESTHYEQHKTVYSNSSAVAAVEIDPNTAQFSIRRCVIIGDCGRIFDSSTVNAQLVGGAAMGLGNALFEHLRYDSNGQILTASLLDYLVPVSTDIPQIEIGHLETPSTFSVNGTKGMGEGGTMAMPAVLANAVADALMEKGRLLNKIPLSEENIFQLLQTA
jgi:carbon-monoxide dehydrogenase large subunit